ncbi:MAG: acyltransferase, partial [Actinomycetes bacterium]
MRVSNVWREGTKVGEVVGEAGAAQAQPARRQKLAYLEVARVVCIFAVVVAHATDLAASRSGPTGLTVFLSTAIRFVVPAFFMISGYLIGAKHRDPAYR